MLDLRWEVYVLNANFKTFFKLERIGFSIKNMSQKILITGGSGLIGMELSSLLTDKGYEMAHLTRKKELNFPYKQFEWDIQKQEIDKKAIEFADVIIHLAGAGVVDEKWTDERKKVIIESRTSSAELLKSSIAKHENKPKIFIGASGINYYGIDTGDEVMKEEDPSGDGFLPEVCVLWEEATDQMEQLGMKTAKVRIGIVLSAKGGALPQLAQPIKLGVGAPLGSGNQMMSWIHIQDLCGIFLHIIENNLSGTYNGVGPNPVTNKDMTKAVAKQLGKPLWVPNVPPFALKLLLADRASMVLGGVNGSAQKILSSGYVFKYPQLKGALQEIYP